VNALRTGIMFLMLYLSSPRDHGRAVLLPVHYSFFIFGPCRTGERDQRLPRGRGLAPELQKILDTPREPSPRLPSGCAELRTLAFEEVSSRTRRQRAALNGISFALEARGDVAFVGPRERQERS